MKRLALSIAAVAAVVAAVAGAAARGNAQEPGGRTITLIAREGSFHFLDNPPLQTSVEAPPSQGDMFVGSQPLFTRANRRAGTLDFHCVAATGGVRPRVHCVGTYGLRGGLITAQTVFPGRPGRVTRIAITGGTGAYEGVRGSVLSRERGTGSIDTIRLLP